MAIVGQWWKKRLPMAVGIATIGSVIGGVLLPIAARNLIQDVG
jgi:MFS transporter, MCT family, solute carrier family 16 (monocarboxylic acid transporters), member 10